MTLIARQDTWLTTVTINDVDYGIWTERKGGTVDSEEAKIYPGGMQSQISLGGSRSVDNVTLSKVFDLDGLEAQVATLGALCGSASVGITQQPLDRDGNVYGTPWSYTGVLKSVSPPEYDANGNDAAMIEIEVSVEGDIS